ncbi:MAG: hypothetical protein ABI587_11010 [Gemmatimonadales bacterium]
MYKIRSASGTEAVYNSLEEFSAAVHRGEVHPEDEIFHTRANRWLDVKSHPHYRSALDWSGPTATPSAPAPSPGPIRSTPVPSPAAAPQARAQLLQRPQTTAASQQTTVRPQLHASPGPRLQAPTAAASPVPSPAPSQPSGPIAKSRELSFVDLGDASPARARVAVAEPPKKAPSPSAAPTQSPTELEFLVMDGGIESPVRSSNGYRTIAPDDLDLLFDAPIEGIEPPARGGVNPGNTPKVTAPPAPPAPKVAAVVVPPAAKPVAPAPAPKAPSSQDVPSQPAPMHPPAPRVITAENLAIPGGPLAASADDFPAESSVPSAPGAPKSHNLMIVGIVASLAVSGGLLAWHPWSGAGATAAVAAESAPPVAGAPTQIASTGPAEPGKAVSGTTAPLASGPGTPASPVVAAPLGIKVDSSLIKPKEETVIAAVKPNFSGAVNVQAADLGLGGDLGAASTVAVASPAEFTRRLESGERQAEQELQAQLAAADFRGVFAGNRLATSKGVTAAQAAWSAGAEAIHQFRARVSRLEQAYEDSVLSSQRAQKWSTAEMRSFASHQSPAEPAEVAQLSDLMMSQVSEALDILAALDGQYELRSGTITFRTPASATRFTGIRGWVEQRMQTWQGIPEGARPRSISAILRALGDGLPSVR